MCSRAGVIWLEYCAAMSESDDEAAIVSLSCGQSDSSDADSKCGQTHSSEGGQTHSSDEETDSSCDDSAHDLKKASQTLGSLLANVKVAMLAEGQDQQL